MGWKSKLVADNVKAMLPFQREMRSLKRHLFPYQPDPANTRLALYQGLQQLKMLRSAGFEIKGKTVLEVGSGWFPVIPLIFRAAEASSIVLTDVERLIDSGTLAIAARLISSEADKVASQLGYEPEELRNWLSDVDGKQLDVLLERFGLRYSTNFHTDVQSGGVDFVISRAVFEHIPPESLIAMLRRHAMQIRDGGAACHIIDNSDHWQHSDNTISRLNFLRYGDLAWRLTCLNVQNYQNRLRHSDYSRLFGECGYAIVYEDKTVDPMALKDLQHMSLHRRFADYEPQDLATLTSYFLVKPTPGARTASS